MRFQVPSVYVGANCCRAEIVFAKRSCKGPLTNVQARHLRNQTNSVESTDHERFTGSNVVPTLFCLNGNVGASEVVPEGEEESVSAGPLEG